MKVAGALTLVAGTLLLALLALWPAEISVLATSASCGPPIVTGLAAPPDGNDLTSAAVRECHARSGQRLLLGFVLFAVASVGGAAMVGVGASQQQPRPYWDGFQWRQR